MLENLLVKLNSVKGTSASLQSSIMQIEKLPSFNCMNALVNSTTVATHFYVISCYVPFVFVVGRLGLLVMLDQPQPRLTGVGLKSTQRMLRVVKVKTKLS